MHGIMINLAEIVKARYRIKNHVHKTPLILSETLSAQVGCSVFVKLESLQKTGAFKVRGIYNKILRAWSEPVSGRFYHRKQWESWHGPGLCLPGIGIAK